MGRTLCVPAPTRELILATVSIYRNVAVNCTQYRSVGRWTVYRRARARVPSLGSGGPPMRTKKRILSACSLFASFSLCLQLFCHHRPPSTNAPPPSLNLLPLPSSSTSQDVHFWPGWTRLHAGKQHLHPPRQHQGPRRGRRGWSRC